MHLCWYTPHALASKQSKMLLSVPAVPIRLHKSLYIYVLVVAFEYMHPLIYTVIATKTCIHAGCASVVQ